MTAPYQEPASMANHPNPGETLRVARESKGWSLASVAQRLNLSERSLAQIESGDFSQLPGHTFARGYVRAYAKLLELDQNRLVQEFDQHTGTNASGSNVTSLGRIEEPGRLSRSVMRFFGFALLLIVAAASFYWWQERGQHLETAPAVTALDSIEVETADGTTQIHLLDRPDEQMNDGEVPPAEGEAEPQLSSTQDAADANGASPASPTAPAEQSSEPAPVGMPAGTVEPQHEKAPAPIPAPAAPETPTAEPSANQAAGESRLVLKYNADCWTRVTDGDGRVLYSALAKAGSEHVVTGKAPLDIHLGFARGAQVSFNGVAVDLAPYVRGETARLKLGQ